jgi:hypothetical protein
VKHEQEHGNWQEESKQLPPIEHLHLRNTSLDECKIKQEKLLDVLQKQEQMPRKGKA